MFDIMRGKILSYMFFNGSLSHPQFLYSSFSLAKTPVCHGYEPSVTEKEKKTLTIFQESRYVLVPVTTCELIIEIKER